MSSLPAETDFYRALVAIETDATRYHGDNARLPNLLDNSAAEQLTAHVAADLQSLIPQASSCSLIVAGALYDQTQVLRPAYPVFRALEDVAFNRNSDKFQPRLVSIAAREGEMPSKALQPLTDIPLGLLQLLPLVIHGPADAVSEIGQQMEYRFLEEGQISPNSAQWLASAFDVKINHARFMTLIDLNAMLRLQLEHFGFLPIWELLDAALMAREEPLTVTTASGRTIEWRDGSVHLVFETFDHWSKDGSGKGVPSDRLRLAAGYGEWTRETRQFLTTLRAHDIEVRFYLPGSEEPLENRWTSETSDRRAARSNTTLTEHSFGELGTIAVTRVEGEKIEHFYPLTPQGLNDIHNHLRGEVPHGHTVAFPGTILYDERQRILVPDSGWK